MLAPRSLPLTKTTEGTCVVGPFGPKENIVARGTVKWFNDQKGFGFIVPDDGSEDLFVHHSNINGAGFKTLAEGQAVEYVAAQGRKGPEAQGVTPC